jgi:hypothetical protein
MDFCLWWILFSILDLPNDLLFRPVGTDTGEVNSPIRAIVSHFSFPFSHAAIEEVLRQRPFEFCALIGADRKPQYFRNIPESSQQWFVSSSTRGSIYPGTNWSTIQPLDEELINRMRSCEALFMDTLQRQEWKYAIPYTLRKHWYLKTLRFWNDYLKRHRINVYLAAWLPHEVPDVVICHLCKLYNIPVLYFHMSTERDTAFVEQDYEKSALQIGRRYEELLIEHADVTDPENIPLSRRFAERYNVLTHPESEQPPLQSLKHKTYWHHVLIMLYRRPLAFVKYAMLYCTPAGLMRASRSLRRYRVISERRALYDSRAIDPDLQQPYVYMALHFQPEASTVPMAGVFNRQRLMAELLDATLPDGVLIYVKEHPKESSWICRSTRDYEDLLEIPRVRLIRRDCDTFILREHCRAVATATGSVGFEALFRGKPVFMFGHRFYQYARGVYRIHTLQDLQRAVHEVFEKHTAPTLKECRLYMKAMEETCVHGTVNPWDRKVSDLSDEKHIRANSEAILTELRRIDDVIRSVV